MKAKKQDRIAAHKKFTCRQFSKNYLGPLRNSTLSLMKERGFLVKQVDQLMHEQVAPWIHEQVFDYITDINFVKENVTDVVSDVMGVAEKNHKQTIQAEHQRRADVKSEEERLKKLKEEEKIRKKIEREERKRQEQLQKLRNEIEENFVKKGESKELMNHQDFTEIHGSLSGLQMMGGVGGPIIHTAIVISAGLEKFPDQIEEFVNKKAIQQFIATYIG